MITSKLTKEMAEQFNTKVLQEIGIAAQRFVNTLDDMNDKPWAAEQRARDDLIALRMLRDACVAVIAAQQ